MSNHKLTAGILIISDTAYGDPSTDKCGAVLQNTFREQAGDQWDVSLVKIIPDSVIEIQRIVTRWTYTDDALNLIVTSGGTGFAIRDNTPEAISPLLHKHAPGLIQAMLNASLAVTPFAAMARPIAGVRHKTVILTLPGSPKGARENLEAVLKLLPHACSQAAGADSRSLHAGGTGRLERDAGFHPGDRPFVIARDPSSVGSQHHHHVHGGHAAPRVHTNTSAHPQSNDPSAGPTRRHRESPYPMISVSEALELIATHTPAPKVRKSAVDGSIIGCVLAEDVKALESVPAFRASIVDGYAVRMNRHGSFERGIYSVAYASAANANGVPTLPEGSVARITTGAPLPEGASAVLMVEDTVLRSRTADGSEELEIEVLTGDIRTGENVREVGSDVKAGDDVLHAGEGISAIGGELGLLASVGTESVGVYSKPIVGVLSTGDEIVPHNRPGVLRLGEVRDTNRPTLLTAVRNAGFEAIDLGIASDKPGALESSLRAALLRADVLVTTGGVSMGELDLLKPTIERSLGGTIHFGRVNMKPGKPTTFGTVPFKPPQSVGPSPSSGERETRLIFALPGNPASAVTTFHLFVLPALRRLSGISPPSLPRVGVVIDTDVRLDQARPEYHRAAVYVGSNGELRAASTGGQRSSRIGSFAGANALLCLPAGEGGHKAGDKVEAILMGMVKGGS